MKTDKKEKMLEICITKWHVLTTLFIIALRALQPNAEPMSEWSVSSWFLMTLPVMFGGYIFLTAWILKIVAEILITLTSKKGL